MTLDDRNLYHPSHMTLPIATEGIGLSLLVTLALLQKVILAVQIQAQEQVVGTGGNAMAQYHDIWSVLDRYGLPMAILAVVFWFGYRVFWPFMIKEVDANREIMRGQLAESRSELKAQGEAFLAALLRRDDMMQAGFQKLHERMETGFRDHGRGNGGKV